MPVADAEAAGDDKYSTILFILFFISRLNLRNETV